MKCIRSLAVACFLFVGIAPLWAQYSGGSGSAADPYQIATAGDLITLGQTPADYGKAFILTADIDLSDYFFDRAVIAPDSDASNDRFDGRSFYGTFDGNGHTIINLTINGKYRDYIGLFGFIFKNAGLPDSWQIKNLGLKNTNIHGRYYVGGLVGNNSGTIHCCYTSGTVTGDYRVGGLVGSNTGKYTNWEIINDSIVSQSFSASAVVGFECVGGLVGMSEVLFEFQEAPPAMDNNDRVVLTAPAIDLTGDNPKLTLSQILQSYATGLVSGSKNVGGLLGYSTGGTIDACFWDTETSGLTSSAGGAGKPTAQMQDIGIFLAAGWDFSDTDGDAADWVMPAGDYPRLAWLLDYSTHYSGGAGTAVDPYQIASAADLFALGQTPADYGKAFILTADIDLSGYTFDRAVIAPDSDASNNAFDGTAFTGTFDGNSHTILNLTINGTGRDYIGMFGRVLDTEQVGVSGKWQIRNLSVKNTDIHGSYYVGGLAGENSGTIHRCYTSGTVAGVNRVGGMIGSNFGKYTPLGTSYDGIVTQSCSASAVAGNDYVGGLVGSNEAVYSYLEAPPARDDSDRATLTTPAIVLADNLTDAPPALITQSYATGLVSGSNRVGGLCGYNYHECSISQSYATGAVTGSGNRFGGLLGYQEIFGTSSGCFWDTETSGLTTSAAGTGLSTVQMQTLTTYADAGWSIVTGYSDSADWLMPAGDYPRLAWQLDYLTQYSGGAGTAEPGRRRILIRLPRLGI